MKLGFMQFAPARGDAAGNIARMASMMEGAGEAVVVAPELATSGYLFPRRRDMERLALRSGDAAFDPLRRVLDRSGGMLAFGFPEQDKSGLFNSVALLGPGGPVEVYRKIHLYDREKKLFDPGDRPPPVVKAAGALLGLMICWDWYFPETARFLASRGAQAILHPANLVLPWCLDAMRTRSIENRVFTVTCNRTGEESLKGLSLSFKGGSQVVSPDGERLLSAGSGPIEGVYSVEIDPAAADEKGFSRLNHGMLDLRAGLLSPLH